MVKNLSVNGGDARDVVLIPGLGRFPSSRKWQSAPVFLPEKFHGQSSLEGYSLWGFKELDMTEHLCTGQHNSYNTISCYIYKSIESRVSKRYLCIRVHKSIIYNC